MNKDRTYSQSFNTVYCDWLEAESVAREGFCIHCGATDHKPIQD